MASPIRRRDGCMRRSRRSRAAVGLFGGRGDRGRVFHMNASTSGLLTLAGAAVLVAGVTITQGMLTERWKDRSVSKELDEAARVLEGAFPKKFGSWEMERELDGDPKELARAGAVGHISRLYRNTRSKARVSVFVVCARPHDASGHTPDRCYPVRASRSPRPSIAKRFPCPTAVPQKHSPARFARRARRCESSGPTASGARRTSRRKISPPRGHGSHRRSRGSRWSVNRRSTRCMPSSTRPGCRPPRRW